MIELLVKIKKMRITHAKTIHILVKNIIDSLGSDLWLQEVGVVIGCKSNLMTMYADLIAIGTVSEATLTPRDIFRMAVRKGAALLFVTHTHPSGDLKFSSSDIETTLRLKECGKLMGIPITDHLVITQEGYTSAIEETIIS